MAIENAFNKDVNYLIEAQKALTQLKDMQDGLNASETEAKRLEREKKSSIKDMEDEVSTALKKRKNGIVDSYDKQIEEVRSKMKNMSAKRDKNKSKQVDARVKQDTAHLSEANRKASQELRTQFKKEKVPLFCSTNFYYTFFATKGIVEFLTVLVTAIIIMIGLPTILCYVGQLTFLKGLDHITVYYILIYCLFVFIPMLIYLIIFSATKVKHRDNIKEGRAVKDYIKANNKQIRAKKNAIVKEKDESIYDLERYDAVLGELQGQMDQLGQDKNDALTVFENETTPVVTEEIQNRYTMYINELGEKIKHAEEVSLDLSAKIQVLSTQIAKDYESFLGKEYMKIEVLGELIAIMQEDHLSAVGDAISAYNGD